jgi:hypothetical protein
LITTTCDHDDEQLSSWDSNVLSGNFVQGISAGGRTMYKKPELDPNGNTSCIIQDGPKGSHRWVHRYGVDRPGYFDGCPTMYYWDEVDNTEAAVFDRWNDKISYKEDCSPMVGKTMRVQDCEWVMFIDAWMWSDESNQLDTATYGSPAYENFEDAVEACLSLPESLCRAITYEPSNKKYYYRPHSQIVPQFVPPLAVQRAVQRGEYGMRYASYLRPPNCKYSKVTNWVY